MDELFKDTDKGDGANQQNAGKELDELMKELDSSSTKDQQEDHHSSPLKLMKEQRDIMKEFHEGLKQGFIKVNNKDGFSGQVLTLTEDAKRKLDLEHERKVKE